MFGLAAIFAVGLLVMIVLTIFSLRFQDRIARLRQEASVEQLGATPGPGEPPTIMRRFAERNGGLAAGPFTVLSRQRAQMRLSPDKAFFDVDATQLSGTRTPAFVWEATAKVASIVPIRVVDSYVRGHGLLEVKVAGAIAMAHATGPENDLGEMMRFLSELPWNPDAILGAHGLSWRQIDDRTVEVSAQTDGGVARVRHIFDANGDIVGIEADDRPYLIDGNSQPTRWIGRFRDYAMYGSYRLPSYGEVAWDLPEGEFVYWRGKVVSFVEGP
jgi:hypothetical protein